MRISAGAQIVCPFDPEKKEYTPITIGAGAIIAPGVTVTQSVPAGAHVVASTPELPGVVDAQLIMVNQPKPDEAGNKPSPKILGDGLELHARGIRHMNAANNGDYQQTANVR